VTPADAFRLLDQGQVRALARMRNAQEVRVFRAGLARLLAECDRQNRYLEGEALYRSQGRAQTLELIEQLFAQAPDHVRD